MHRRLLLFLVLVTVCLAGAPPRIGFAGSGRILRVAYFSNDVNGIDPFSATFDPDAYAVITQIFDSLVYLDLDGSFRAGLATRWEQLSPTSWLFHLREDVRFHNGEPFDARSVKFTYDYAIDPRNQCGNAWILNSIDKTELVPGTVYQVIIHTRFPDGMFLNRLSMFGSICPPGYIAAKGMRVFAQKPVGTGPFMLVSWNKGRSIELERNPHYWQKGIPKIERVRFDILPEETWLDAFLAGEVDFVPNLSGNQTTRLMRQADGRASILKRLVLSGYWVLLSNRGILGDLRVRRALNHAVNKDALVRLADYGNARPLASLGKVGEFGADPGITPYTYSKKLAKNLLADAGVKLPVHLKAIASDIAARVAKIVKHDLEEVGIILDLEIVSRTEWARRVVDYKMKYGKPADFDLAVNLVDNPIHDLAFHAGLFLQSRSPWSLLDSPEFDRRFAQALQTTDRGDHRKRLMALDRYIHDQALLIFTTQRVITAAVKPDLEIPRFSLSGHLDYLVLSTAAFRRTR